MGSKRRGWWVLLLLLGCFGAGCHGTVPAVGIAENGEEMVLRLDKHAFRAELEQAAVSVNESTLPALQAARSNHGWHLDLVRVGLGLRAGGGIGVARIDGAIGFQVLFKHHPTP